MPEANGVQIAAGGYGTRLRNHMTEMGYEADFPKHLLPTGNPNGETFLGRIVRQALTVESREDITVYANPENRQHIAEHPDVDSSIRIRTDRFTQSLEPFFTRLLLSRNRVLACAGDFYADFDWRTVLDHHESHPYPLTFVTGNTVAVEKGAAFEVADTGKIEHFGRPERSRGQELINVGIYVFEAEDRVISMLDGFLRVNRAMPKDDTIVQAFIDRGLAGAYVLPTMPFNVNTPETYGALLHHTSDVVQVS